MSERNHEQDRRTKMGRLREIGVDPFGGAAETVSLAMPVDIVRAAYDQSHGKDGGPKVAVNGRILLRRGMGKLSFVTLTSDRGDIQLAFDHSRLSEQDRDIVKNLDLGDVIFVAGTLGATQTGEITIWATSIKMLAKALTPPPDKVDGLKNIETRYRERHVDLWNEDVREIMRNRSQIIMAIRKFMNGHLFMEVETPMMQSSAGGATARPFMTHHNALDIDLFMRIAPELYLKKLIIGGFERVFEIGKNFRNEGIDSTHNPEFTSMEAYWAFTNMDAMMHLLENLVAYVANTVFGTTEFEYNGEKINVKAPWPRRRLIDLAKTIDPARDYTPEEAYKQFDDCLSSTLMQPMFVYGMPTSLFPLAKHDAANPGYSHVFELYMGGMELAPGYTEQNDPDEQLLAFGSQKADGHVMDHDFIDAMKSGMPPMGGLGLGIDRLVAIMTNQKSIRDVILFPLLRPKE